ncbi:MAG: hypothetical protein AAGC81_06610 [Pseudomonadota bacterium]
MHKAFMLVCLCLLAGCKEPIGETLGLDVTLPIDLSQEADEVPSTTEASNEAQNSASALPPPQPSGQSGVVQPLAAPELRADLTSREQQVAFAAAQAPRIYMAIQEDGSRPLSIVFAIDEARDGDPSNDPAIRITPEDGTCNPQAMRSYGFPAPFNAPVFSSDQVLQGVRADQLPAFMAIAVSEKIVGLGLKSSLQETRPQNICTRKLWEAQLENPVQPG